MLFSYCSMGNWLPTGSSLVIYWNSSLSCDRAILVDFWINLYTLCLPSMHQVMPIIAWHGPWPRHHLPVMYLHRHSNLINSWNWLELVWLKPSWRQHWFSWVCIKFLGCWLIARLAILFCWSMFVLRFCFGCNLHLVLFAVMPEWMSADVVKPFLCRISVQFNHNGWYPISFWVANSSWR